MRSKYAEFMQLHSQEPLTPFAHSANNRCFGCGSANASGLHLEFLRAPDGAVVSLPIVPEAFEGHPGYLHGGIIASLLDEAMSKAVRVLGRPSMTRKMEVEYLRPVPSGATLRCDPLLQVSLSPLCAQRCIVHAAANCPGFALSFSIRCPGSLR